jgi:hypothetical protein
MVGFRECKSCNSTKSLAEFYRRKRYEKYPDSLAGYATKCKPCSNKERREYRLQNLEKCNKADTNSRLKRTYGIDLTQYNLMFVQQSGKCLGCNRHQTEFKKGLVVDHCHATGNVRGLLCTPCNLVLGYVNDNINVLENLKNYLTKYPELAANTNVLLLEAVKKVG